MAVAFALGAAVGAEGAFAVAAGAFVALVACALEDGVVVGTARGGVAAGREVGVVFGGDGLHGAEDAEMGRAYFAEAS